MAEHTSKFVLGAMRLAEQWPYLRYLGMGAWWAWIWLCYNDVGLYALWPEAADPTSSVGLMYLFSTPAIALATGVAAVGHVRATRMLESRAAVLGVSLVATLGVLVIALSRLAGDAGGVAFAVGAVLTGLGTSVLCLKTGSVYGTLGLRDLLTAGSVSVMFSAFLYFMGTGLPDAWRPFFIAVLPMLSAALYIMPAEDEFPAAQPRGRTRKAPGHKSFAHLTVAVVMISVTAGFGKGLASAQMAQEEFAYVGAVVTFLVFLGAVAVCFLVNCGEVLGALRRVYAALILFGVVVALVSNFGLNLVYLTVGKELLWMLFTCLMAYMVFRFDFSPVRAFGLGQVAYFIASAAAWLAGIMLAEALDVGTTHMIIAVAMVLAIVAVYAFAFTDSDLKFIATWHAHGARNGEGEPSVVQAALAAVQAAPAPDAPASTSAAYVPPADLTLHERIAAIDERFGVSSREAEIMELFAGGRSANWIAEELVISKNTVRSHLRAIYTKLDVHSRQELLDFLKTVS